MKQTEVLAGVRQTHQTSTSGLFVSSARIWKLQTPSSWHLGFKNGFVLFTSTIGTRRVYLTHRFPIHKHQLMAIWLDVSGVEVRRRSVLLLFLSIERFSSSSERTLNDMMIHLTSVQHNSDQLDLLFYYWISFWGQIFVWLCCSISKKVFSNRGKRRWVPRIERFTMTSETFCRKATPEDGSPEQMHPERGVQVVRRRRMDA